MINKFITNLEDLKKAIENENSKKLDEIIKAVQNASKPDFGKK